MREQKEIKKWKLSIIVWLAIMPLMFTIPPYFTPKLLALVFNQIAVDLLLTTVLVLLVVYVTQPILIKFFGKWATR